MSSTGITSTAGVINAWNTGTIANTGGAMSPSRWAWIGSLVAAAYSAIRSRVTSKRSSSLQMLRLLSSNDNSSSVISCTRSGGQEVDELGYGLVELSGAVLFDSLAERTLDQRAVEVAGHREPRGSVAGRLKVERERACHARHACPAHRQLAWRLDAVDGPVDLVGHAQHHDLGRKLRPGGQGGRHVGQPLLVEREPIRPCRRVANHRPDRVDGCRQFAFGFDVSHRQFLSARWYAVTTAAPPSPMLCCSAALTFSSSGE